MRCLLTMKQVSHRVTLSRTSIYNGIAAKTFPQPIRLSANRVAWVEKDIDGWIAKQFAENKYTPWSGAAGARA